mgnify:CR=1 FL=1
MSLNVLYDRRVNFRQELQAAAQRYAAARAAATQAEAKRDDLIRRAHHEGGLSARDMAEPLGLSFQRVATVIAGDPDRPLRQTLHGAMRQVLEENGGGWVAAHELARLIYGRELYSRKDRGVIPPGQVRARAAKYPDLFEGTTDGTNRIRLRAEDKG